MAARKKKDRKKFTVSIYVEAIIDLDVEADTMEEARTIANATCLIDSGYVALDECELADFHTRVRSVADLDVRWPGSD